MIRNLRTILKRLSVDRAVAYVLATRIWQSVSYLVSAFLITRYFTAGQQGYYYTFLSLLSLQVFVELGLALVIINAASHEWASLGVNEKFEITGDPNALSRLVSLGRIVFKWYAAAMVIFVLGAGLAGALFFSKNSGDGVDWKQPWITLIILAGVSLCLTPFNALLEGCNQIISINRVKFQQVVFESTVAWSTLVLGLGLWCLPLSLGVRLFRNLFFIFYQYRKFFSPFLHGPTGRSIDWVAELWPMQWRLAIQGLVVFFFNSMFNPVMFHFHGAAVAGKTGMTLQMINGMQIISMAWISTKVPTFGNLIAKRNFADLDNLWFRTAITSLGVLLVCLITFSAFLVAARRLNLPLSQRLLDPPAVILFSAATFMVHITQCFAFYLRAHRREPIMIASITASALTGVLVWFWGKRWGPAGAGAAYLVPSIMSVIWFRIIWGRCRREWHVVQA